MILGGPGSETYPIGWAPLANICKESYKQMFPTFWFSVEKYKFSKNVSMGPPWAPMRGRPPRGLGGWGGRSCAHCI
jgi:hypothetical protein